MECDLPQFLQANYHNFSKYNATIFPNHLHKSIIISTFAANLKIDKLGSAEVDAGAAHLLKLQSLIREYNLKEKQVPIREPDLLIVLTGGKVGFRRKDGVYVIPIGCLKD